MMVGDGGFVFITFEDVTESYKKFFFFKKTRIKRQYKIGHSIGWNVRATTNFEFEDMDMWIKYFNRI